MNGQVYLEIEDSQSLISFLTEAKEKTGMLKDVSIDDVKKKMETVQFPIRIPVNLDGVIKLCENRVLRGMFGKRVETKTLEYLKAAMGAG